MTHQKADEIFTVDVDGQSLARFIPHPLPIKDGTSRCISCGQIDEEPYHKQEYCPAMGGALPQTDNVKIFILANALSPVIAGRGFKNGGGTYRLDNGQQFRFSLLESRSMDNPRWKGLDE